MRSRHTLLVLLAAALAALVGCQAMFTYSPLKGLQRPPSSMTPGQRLTYAQDALASGDTAAMTAAYQAIMNDPSAEAQYTTAQLGIELSGVPDLLVEIAGDPSTVTTQLNSINTFITDNNLDPNFMVAAAGQLIAAAAAGATLTTMDYAMLSMGLMLGFARTASGGTSWDITLVNSTDAGTARAFLAPAVTNVASLPPGDSLRAFIEDYDSYLGTF